MNLLDLPEDIRLAIYAYVSPEDVLSLNQTCRGLHAFGCTDYTWHQIRVDLPLDLPSDHDAKSLPGSQLQGVIMKALRLERNWRKDASSIRHCRRIPVALGEMVYHVQFLRPRWLVCLSKSRSTTQISVWRFSDNEGASSLVSSSKIQRSALKISATLQTESKAVIAAIESDGPKIAVDN